MKGKNTDVPLRIDTSSLPIESAKVNPSDVLVKQSSVATINIAEGRPYSAIGFSSRVSSAKQATTAEGNNNEEAVSVKELAAEELLGSEVYRLSCVDTPLSLRNEIASSSVLLQQEFQFQEHKVRQQALAAKAETATSTSQQYSTNTRQTKQQQEQSEEPPTYLSTLKAIAMSTSTAMPARIKPPEKGTVYTLIACLIK